MKNPLKILTLVLILHCLNLNAQDYLESVTATGSGITTDNSQEWTDIPGASVTIDLGSDISDTKYVLVTASINMRPGPFPLTNTSAREGNYNIYRSDDKTDNSGVIKRQIKALNGEPDVQRWGIGTLVHIFNVSGLSGTKTYKLEHSNQGTAEVGRNVESKARLTVVALSTTINHYELSNDVKRLGETGVTTTSSGFTVVTGLTTEAITLPVKGDIYVSASINGKADGAAVAEYKLQYSTDNGSNWLDLGKPIKRSMINIWDDGIVSLVGLLQGEAADNDFKFRVAHKRVSGSATVTTHNSNLVAVALSHSNGGYFPAFYSEVDATGVDIIGLNTPATTVTSATFTAAADIGSTGTNLFVNSQYLVSASNLDGSDRMRAGNQLKVSGASSGTAEEYYRYIPENANLGAGGFIGLMEDLVGNGAYTISMEHQIAALSGSGGGGDETLKTSEVILAGFQTYDQTPSSLSTNKEFLEQGLTLFTREEKVILRSNKPIDAKIKIYNVLGQLIKQENFKNESNMSIKVNYKGVIIVNIELSNGIFSKKMLL
ncbi:T9SS type A sorting domain-containing protein [Lutibacter citreus]|uniref:T9SS type A sorting domain-containing protein n=1 Tax=Lutibacter citreus TaxID=2138210 RepID=UPI000DBE25FB|nr:T9SS type A sorting domain-containing protein [Lutibacter citreus]